jgi:hypothetical protein
MRELSSGRFGPNLCKDAHAQRKYVKIPAEIVAEQRSCTKIVLVEKL